MDKSETKYQARVIQNISEVSTVQETIDVKIDNIKDKNIKIENVDLKTQSINNLFSSDISKKKICLKICKILCILICLISLLFILTLPFMIYPPHCHTPPKERLNPIVDNISYMTNNTKEFDNN